MKARAWSMALLGFGFICTFGQAAEPSTAPAGVPAIKPPSSIPIQDFFRNPVFLDPILSPNGRSFLGRIQDDDDNYGLLVFDIEKLKARHLMPRQDRDVYTAAWMGDRYILATLEQYKSVANSVVAIDTTQVDPMRDVIMFSEVVVLGVPPKNPRVPLIWVRQDATTTFGDDAGVIEVDTGYECYPEGAERRGWPQSVMKGYPQPSKGVTRSYLASATGQLVFARTQTGETPAYHRWTGKAWETLPINPLDYRILSVGDDNLEAIAIGPDQDGKPPAIVRLDATTGATKEVLYQDTDYTPEGIDVYAHPATGKVLGFSLNRRWIEQVWLDPEMAALSAAVGANFPGQKTIIVGQDQAGTRFLFNVFSDRTPDTYYLLDRKQNTLKVLSSTRPWINPEQMAATQALRFKARDGVKIEAYLTLPQGATKANPPPMVVLSHGGPWARDSWEWNGEVQFLASRGYAVLQINYRGSTSYSWQFSWSDLNDFIKMHQDVTDGVKKICQSGLVDSKRIAIMGTSFGGYLAITGAAWEPDLYKCAITEAGVFDWVEHMRELERFKNEDERYSRMVRRIGSPSDPASRWAEFSVLKDAGKIKCPVFIAGGKDDRIVDIRQSKLLIEELKKANIPYKTLLKGGEGHGMAYTKNRVALMTEVEKFLAENLGK